MGAWGLGLLVVLSIRISSLPTGPVVTQLEAGHFFDDSITKQHLFASVHDAVTFALHHRKPGPKSPDLVS